MKKNVHSLCPKEQIISVAFFQNGNVHKIRASAFQTYSNQRQTQRKQKLKIRTFKICAMILVVTLEGDIGYAVESGMMLLIFQTKRYLSNQSWTDFFNHQLLTLSTSNTIL